MFLKFLFALFLAICVGVHLYGLGAHFTDESNASHIIHIASYALCLFALLKRVDFRLAIYFVGSLYPFFYHANCAWNTFYLQHTLNGICLLVVVLLPLIGVFIGKQNRSAV